MDDAGSNQFQEETIVGLLRGEAFGKRVIKLTD